MINVKNISEGYYNLITGKYNEEFDKREKICNNCDDYNSFLGSCKHCFCLTKAKTKSLNESCPIGKW